ncbi:hypothetical protein [Lacticaseibacillus sp. N501-2]|uniref:hypothetical protein n=1 Tax=Lacticaseibacillus salsurae TaxID=3367729 RepID=UPI0038B3743B
METPRVYYNTITITKSHFSFIVGLIQEVYDHRVHQPARTRWLLAYQPNIGGPEPALPVRNERLHVMTATDWQQSNQRALPSMVNAYFREHDHTAVATYFSTYIPQNPQPPLDHIIAGSDWPTEVQKAQQLLKIDLAAFILHKTPTLPQAPLAFKTLGYFTS